MKCTLCGRDYGTKITMDMVGHNNRCLGGAIKALQERLNASKQVETKPVGGEMPCPGCGERVSNYLWNYLTGSYIHTQVHPCPGKHAEKPKPDGWWEAEDTNNREAEWLITEYLGNSAYLNLINCSEEIAKDLSNFHNRAMFPEYFDES